MDKDPFVVLGVTSSSSEDEIKSAYRKLAKKYHPDVNGGSAEAEAKMKEINEAYSEALKLKRSGQSWRPEGSGPTGGNGGYGGSGYGYGGNQGDRDPFGFGGFGFDGFGFGGYQRSYHSASSPELQAARSHINAGRYREAEQILHSTNVRSAEWYYLSARSSLGLGNRAAALTHARQAAQMEPDNYEYAALVSRLEGRSENYRQTGSPFGGIPLNACNSPCAWICALNILCNCCCGARSCCY